MTWLSYCIVTNENKNSMKLSTKIRTDNQRRCHESHIYRLLEVLVDKRLLRLETDRFPLRPLDVLRPTRLPLPLQQIDGRNR